MAEAGERAVLTLGAENFEKLAQMGRDRCNGDFRGRHSWGDREFAVYEIANLIADAESRV